MQKNLLLMAVLAFLPPAAAQTPPKPPAPAPVVVRAINGVDQLDVKEADIFTIDGVGAKDFSLVNLDVFPSGALTVQKFLTGDGVVLFVKASKPGPAAVFVDVNAPPFVLLKKEILVGGGVTPPNPPEPPVPQPVAGPYQVLIWVESADLDNLPLGQRYPASLRWREKLKSEKHKLVGVLDPDVRDASGNVPTALSGWYSAIEGKKLPLVAIAPIAGGDIVTYPLPSDESAFWALLKRGGK